MPTKVVNTKVGIALITEHWQHTQVWYTKYTNKYRHARKEGRKIVHQSEQTFLSKDESQ